MDNQLLITWAFMLGTGLVIDVAAYIFLRQDWKKNGSSIVDRFWDMVFNKTDQLAASAQKQIAIALLKYHRSAIAESAKTDSPNTPEAKPETQPEAAPELLGELIPVTVQNDGNLRRINFTLDMALDTQVEVRIGASREAGVTVEKREL